MRVPHQAGPGPDARALAGRVVGVYASGGAPWHHLALAAAHGAQVRPVRAEDVAAGRLDELDVLVVPGGGAIAMAGLLAPLGREGAERIRAWVERGGSYVSSCAGSVLPLALHPEADALMPTARCLRMVEVPMANPGDATLGGLASPGVGRIVVRLDPEHGFAGGLPERVELVHYNGPLFDVSRVPAGVRPFAWPIAASTAFTPGERFLPSEPAVEDDATTFARCVARGAATGLDASVGDGRAVLFGSHPEFGLGRLLLGWSDGASLLVAALATCRHPRRHATAADDPGWSVRAGRRGDRLERLAHDASGALRGAADRFMALADVRVDAWLRDDHAATFHGRDARTAWRDDTVAAAEVARIAASALERVTASLDGLDRGWLDDVPRDDQDFGAMGLVQLVDRVHAMLGAADRFACEAPVRPAHAYDHFDRHPFHLAVGSYLSAAGLVSAAMLIVQVLAARHGIGVPDEAARLLWLPTASDRSGGI